jgi:hypothetical protein
MERRIRDLALIQPVVVPTNLAEDANSSLEVLVV